VPAADEVLIRVHATTVNRTDNATIKAIPFFARLVTGLFRPRKNTPGTSFAGEVIEVGNQVKDTRVGERVFGFNDQGARSQAEYMTSTEPYLATIPGDISYAQAAAGIEGAHYGRNFLNKVAIGAGQQVLVNGATGAIGSATVQLLVAIGVKVTGVCSTRNIALVKSLGAEKVIDYTREDFTRDPQRYDYVFDAVGKSSFFQCYNILKPGGVYISSDLGYLAQNIFLPMVTPLVKFLLAGKTTRFPVPVDIKASLLLVQKLMAEGKFEALIDRTYEFDDIIAAYRYVEKGHKTGNVVVKL